MSYPSYHSLHVFLDYIESIILHKSLKSKKPLMRNEKKTKTSNLNDCVILFTVLWKRLCIPSLDRMASHLNDQNLTGLNENHIRQWSLLRSANKDLSASESSKSYIHRMTCPAVSKIYLRNTDYHWLSFTFENGLLLGRYLPVCKGQLSYKVLFTCT